MATVWAAREDAFKWKNDTKTTGWSHSFKFTAISDLIQQMRATPPLKGAVTKLAIVAHGDQQGEVQLDRRLTPESATTFKQEFTQLQEFLGSYARLIFFSCIAGGGERGSLLLNIISGQFLPQRHIIGFEVHGGVGPGAAARLAGDIGAVDSPPPFGGFVPAGPGSKSSVLTEYSWHSKWSLDGKIIRLSRNHQGAPGYVESKAYGIRAVEDAIRKHISFITHVYVENDRVRARIPAVDQNLVRGKVELRTRDGLTALAGTPKHEGVVVIWNRMVLNYRCADPRCPGHTNPWEFCQAFANGFPNGPLK